MANKKVLIEYLDLGDGRYIENDNVKSKVTESIDDYLTWDQLWTGVKNDMEKIKDYERLKISSSIKSNLCSPAMVNPD